VDFEAYLPTNRGDILQLLVIWMVIYALLRVVRGTIAASILRGALIMVAAAIVLAAFVLSAFELTVLQEILSQLLNAVIFALIVVFQPELRRGLLSLGEHRFFDRFRARPRSCLDDLARAAVNLSRERHGALFAVERRAALSNIVESGVEIDAEARAELLANIFWPGAPMHDGGVVIRGDRVIAAGCIFPLAERRDLTSRLGTRHRAGIGLSEQTDAIVVIVSEETGRVSIAVDGEMRPVDPPGDLSRILRELSETPTEPPAPPPDDGDEEPDDEGENEDEDEPGDDPVSEAAA
jgi:diadenylate cyclase